MKTSHALPLIALLLFSLVVGCAVPSLYGFEDETRFEFDPGLVGTWIADDEKEETLYRVGPGEGNTYEVVVSETKDGQTTSLALRAAVVRFGDRFVVDVSLSEEESKNLAGQYGLLALPVHQFYLLVLDGDRLRVDMLEEDWIEQWPGVLERDNLPIVAANPDQLMRLIGAAAQDEQAWGDTFVLRRKD